MRAELTQDHRVGLGELIGRVAEHVERADDAALAAERHDELGVRTRHGLDVARIVVHVVHQHRLPSATAAPTSPWPTFNRSVRALSGG